MLTRNAPALLIAVALLYCSGCVCTHSSMYGSGVGCGVGDCGDCGDCGVAACEPACGCGVSTCDSGCGEVYWGEWTNNPPDCCDPCDGCGNWTGDVGCNSCCTPWSPFAGLANLWGYRYTPACGVGGYGGCDSCGGVADGMYMSDEMYTDGEVYMDGGMPIMQGGETVVRPQPEPEPTSTTKAASLKRRVRHTGQTRVVRR
jgi:hypothetical protein